MIIWAMLLSTTQSSRLGGGQVNKSDQKRSTNRQLFFLVQQLLKPSTIYNTVSDLELGWPRQRCLSCLIWSYLISSHLISSHLILCYLTLSCRIFSCRILSLPCLDLILSCRISFYITYLVRKVISPYLLPTLSRHSIAN